MITSTLKKSTVAGMTGLMLLSAPMVGVISSVVTSTAIAGTTQNANQNEVAAKRLNKLLKNLNSMSASFSQTTQGGKVNKGSLAKNRNFSGTMLVQRPNNLRWQTQSPSEQLIVVNGSKMWIYDKDLEQVTKQSAKNQIGNTPALLLSGDYKKIAKNFTITQPYANKHYYKLYPKTKDANLNSMTISFKGGKPVMMVINDSLGQATSIKFSNIKLNPSIAKSKFNFKIPKGVDVISQ